MRRTSFLVVLLLIAGCSEDFNPVAEGERPYVVFALLNASSQLQIVRVHETAEPSASIPGNPALPGTLVRITGPEGSIVLRDTTLVPPPGSGDTASVHAYVAEPFTPVRGSTYSLEVTSPRGRATSTMTVPTVADMSSTDDYVLQGPYTQSTTKGISVKALLSQYALGYVVRLLIEYERLVGGVWVKEIVEVPTVYRGLVTENDFTAEYPFMTRRVSPIVTSTRGFREPESGSFRNSVYLQTLSILYRTYDKADIRMNRALYVLTQADTHFFTYYSFANFFQDRLTIRVDQPDYSNVDGALGFFGSLTTDTLAVSLPPNLSPPL